jgi:hypothetical protein
MDGNDDRDDQDRYEGRIVRLERALMQAGGRRVVLNAIGELDLPQLEGEMRRIGFEFMGCTPLGHEFHAEFRKRSANGGRAIHGAASSFSQHNAEVEAAIVALDTAFPYQAPPSANGPGGSLSPVRRLRAWARPWSSAVSRPGRSVGLT